MNSGSKANVELYLKVLKAMPYGIIISDKSSNFVFWNDKASHIMHITAQAIKQQDWVKKFGVYDLDKTTMYKTEDLPMSKALRGEFIDSEKLYIKNENMEEGIYIKVTAFPVLENDEIIAAVVMFDDITDEQTLYDSVIHKITELESYLKDFIKIKIIP